MNKKRILIFIVFLLVVPIAVYAEPMEVLNPQFNLLNGEPVTIKTMGFTPDDWTFASGCDDDGIELPSSDGGIGCAAVGGEDSIYQLLEYTIAPGDEYTLKFDTFFLWAEPPTAWNCAFEGRLYYDDDGERAVLDLVEDSLVLGGWDGVWYTDNTLYTNVPSDSPAIGKQLGIELASFPSGSGTWLGFDNVRLEGELGGVKCLNPTNGAENVPIDTNLEWAAPIEYTALYYDLYFGKDANELSPRYFAKEPILEKTEQTSHTPDKELSYETTYYWRVDAYEANDVGEILHEGNVWSFTTVPKEPVILEQPSGVTVPAGGTAEITIVATNATMYEWYKEGTPDQLIDSGETMDTLVIAGVQQSDEGLYYCKLINDNGSTRSESVWLMTERLISHWKFEGDLTDEVGKDEVNVDGDWPGTYVDPNEGAPIPTPVFWYVDDANSIDGKAILMPGDGKHVQIPDPRDFFNFLTNGITISTWVRLDTQPTGWDCYMGKEGSYWFDIDDGYSFICGFGDIYFWAEPYGAIDDGDWHLLVTTYDSDTNLVKAYVDGALGGEGSPMVSGSDLPICIGAAQIDGRDPYLGLLDEIQIWSYPLDSIAIAQLYTDKNPGEMVCMEPVPNDFNGDCKVDIADLGEMLSAWLECNRIPQEDCY